MANYLTQFSTMCPVGPGNVAAALALYEEMRAELEGEGAEIGFVAEAGEPKDEALWLWDGDGIGDIENVIAFVLRCAGTFDLTGLFGFTWSLSCDRPRVDSFGGGAQLLDLGRRGSLGWMDCQHWLGERTGMEEPRTVLTEMILDPVAAAEGWTVATQLSVLLGFIDSLIAADPAVANQFRSRLADVSAEPDEQQARDLLDQPIEQREHGA